MSQSPDHHRATTAAADPTSVPAAATPRRAERSGSAHDCSILLDRPDTEQVKVLRVIGQLDWATARRFHDLIDAECGDGPVAVDLTLAQLDSAGTAILLSVVAAAHRRGQPLALVVTDPVATGVLARLQVAEMVPMVDSLPAARRRLREAARQRAEAGRQ